MILVDTSFWIELFNSKKPRSITDDQFRELAVCPPVIQEVLQGIDDPSTQGSILNALLGFEILGEPLGVNLYISAAEIYSAGRRKGLTIRSSIYCLIAAIAIDSKVPILHKDRDFDVISKFTPLEVRTSLLG